MEDKSKQADFFKQIAKDKRIENPFDSDEILFRDKDGNLKIIKEGQTSDFNQTISIKKSARGKTGTQLTVSQAAPVIVVKKKEPPALAGKPLNVDEEIKQIINKSGVDLTDDKMAQRFKVIITSRLKGVRDQVQTREMLLASSMIGGMGYTSQIADRVLEVISQETSKLDGRLRDEVSTESLSDLQAEANELLSQSLPNQSEELPDVILNQEVKPVATILAPIKPLVPEKITAPPVPDSTVFQKPKTVAQQVSPVVPIISEPKITKPKIEDVKFKPKLTGPIEEIRSMSLTDFRRLGDTPEEAITKIIEKVQLLEEESFTKKTEAIKAWKESNIYSLYLELGYISMEEKKPISVVIANRQQANQPTLSQDELEAVIELNKKLRF